MDLTKGVVGGGSGQVAYIIDSPFPPCLQIAVPGIFLRTFYDCFGRSISRKNRWDCNLSTGGSIKNITVTAYGTIADPPHHGLDMIYDVRTLKMIADGCCPPAILLDFLETGEGPD